MAIRRFTLTDTFQAVATSPCIITVLSSIDNQKLSIHEGDADLPMPDNALVYPQDWFERKTNGTTYAKGLGVVVSVNQQGAYA